MDPAAATAPSLAATALAVAAGAAIGALLRWALAEGLNAAFPLLPPGTLMANLIGGFAIGVALAAFARHPEWAAAWRPFLVTGLLGGLTTFSTFSAEIHTLLMQGRVAWAFGAAAAHLAGSLLATAAGWAAWQAAAPNAG
jgi:CrcB protein